MNTNNKPKTILLVGPPGSGKGTQADFLKEELKDREVLYLYTGDRFRSLLDEEKTLTTQLLKKEILDAGELAPTFLSTWAWSAALVHRLSDEQHLIFDGSPRTAIEAYILDSALTFYHRTDAKLIVIDVPEELITERLLGRGRHDDTAEVIAERFRLYTENVEEIMNRVDTNASAITLHKIDGTGTPEEVFARIKEVIS